MGCRLCLLFSSLSPYALPLASMFVCPHCDEPSISALRKVGASDTLPVRCMRCSGLSCVSAWAHFAGAFVFEGLFWGTAIAAMVAKSWSLLLMFPLGSLAWCVFVGAVFPLRPIDKADVSRARRRAAVLVAGSALLLAGIAVVKADW